jgi:hypothetical protein
MPFLLSKNQEKYKGYCQDMCPEKEYDERMYKFRDCKCIPDLESHLAIYELDKNGTPQPNLAIKRFKR